MRALGERRTGCNEETENGRWWRNIPSMLGLRHCHPLAQSLEANTFVNAVWKSRPSRLNALGNIVHAYVIVKPPPPPTSWCRILCYGSFYYGWNSVLYSGFKFYGYIVSAVPPCPSASLVIHLPGMCSADRPRLLHYFQGPVGTRWVLSCKNTSESIVTPMLITGWARVVDAFVKIKKRSYYYST